MESAKDLFGKVIKRGDTVIYVCNDRSIIKHGVITNIKRDTSDYILIEVKNRALSIGQKDYFVEI